jgi:type III pantothenate kinase
MLLAFDIGNTETTVGLFSDDDLRAQWRLTTQVPRTPDELRFLLSQLITSADCAPSEVTGAVIASVVPPSTPPLVDACRICFGVSAVVVTTSSPLPITLDVDEPATVGADRIINTLAASHFYRRDAIVVDLGTATTYDCITAAGAFLGGVIQPGVRTSTETLVRKTSMLPATAIIAPAQVIGKNTTDCIKAGVVFGTADSIDGLIRRIKREWPTSSVPYVVATGGLSPVFAPLCSEFDTVDQALTLKGLQLAYTILNAPRNQ